MLPTEWTPVASSNVSAVKWEDGTLYVRYQHGGEYAYPGVEAEEAESVLHASSVGKAVAALAKGRAVRKA